MEGSESENESRLNQDSMLPRGDCDLCTDIVGDERRGCSYAAARQIDARLLKQPQVITGPSRAVQQALYRCRGSPAGGIFRIASNNTLSASLNGLYDFERAATAAGSHNA